MLGQLGYLTTEIDPQHPQVAFLFFSHFFVSCNMECSDMPEIPAESLLTAPSHDLGAGGAQ